jgi:hypothetical protein
MTVWIRGWISGQISSQTLLAGFPSAHGNLAPSVSRTYLSLAKNVSSGPHAIHIANREVRSTWRLEARL